MIATTGQDRIGKLGEYLEHLRSLTQELERSIQAIKANQLSPLEESVTNQHALAERLRELADDLRKLEPAHVAGSQIASDEEIVGQIQSATETLRTLNRRYAALLQLSSHSVGLMISLFSSFRGQIQEDPGTRLKHQTWSCQV
jgi:flagellar biosynthesis/type III secretory pathway chaperone